MIVTVQNLIDTLAKFPPSSRIALAVDDGQGDWMALTIGDVQTEQNDGGILICERGIDPNQDPLT
jgi:hypothetical protein